MVVFHPPQLSAYVSIILIIIIIIIHHHHHHISSSPVTLLQHLTAPLSQRQNNFCVQRMAPVIKAWRKSRNGALISSKRGADRGMAPVQCKAPHGTSNSDSWLWKRHSLLPHHQIATDHAMKCEGRFRTVSGLEVGSNFILPSHSSSFIIRCENPAKRTCNSACCMINRRFASDGAPDSKD